MPTVTLDLLQFALLVSTALSVGACWGCWYARRRTLAECDARIAAAFDAGERLGFSQGVRHERGELPGSLGRRGW